MKIQFQKLHPFAKLPAYQTSGAAGFDFSSVEDVELKSGEVSLVSTGLAVQIPEGYELQMRARSGLAAKFGIFLVNGVGTIDSDYRGEIKIIMSTCKSGSIQLKAGERIAQGVLAKVERAEVALVAVLDETDRAEGGFGSTGRV